MTNDEETVRDMTNEEETPYDPDANRSRRVRAIQAALTDTEQAFELTKRSRQRINQLNMPEEQAECTDEAWTYLDAAIASLRHACAHLRKANSNAVK